MVCDYMAASLVTVTNCPGLVSDLVQRSGGGLGVGPTKLAFGLREVSALSPHERLSLGLKGMIWIRENQSRSAMARRLNIPLSASTRVHVSTSPLSRRWATPYLATNSQ